VQNVSNDPRIYDVITYYNIGIRSKLYTFVSVFSEGIFNMYLEKQWKVGSSEEPGIYLEWVVWNVIKTWRRSLWEKFNCKTEKDGDTNEIDVWEVRLEGWRCVDVSGGLL
jgi:hypothetical protein